MCYFHACLLERRKFGPMGWNMFYPFSIGDLRDSYYVLCKNIENNASGRLPWADLKYIFGEIMYGGHITDPFDRRTNTTYLECYIKKDLMTNGYLV
jgi:dynein heavy chain